MGLDMYLKAKIYLSMHNEKDKERQLAVRKIFPESFLTDNINCLEVKFEAGYWRKANQIHNWFIINVQNGQDDCERYDVSRPQLIELRNLCLKAMDKKEEADKILETKSGFFFGDTDYGDDYFADLKRTVEIIDRVLALPPDWDFEYRASW